MSLEVKPHDVSAIIENIVALFRETTEDKKLHFNIDVTDQLPSCLMIDQLRFKQVLFNLLGNAIKFTPSRGNVSLEIGYDESTSFLHCAVIDTGIGIDKEKLEKIFTAFEQGDSTTTRQYGGTGLGLTISSKLLIK